MITPPGTRDRGLGIRTVTGITLMLAVLAPGSLCAQSMSAPAPQRGAAKPTTPTNPTPPPSAKILSKTVVMGSDLPVSPIECWWKTDRSAVTVGENFQLTLTCAVLATDRVSVVVDESSLEPSALHLTPFEIVGGQRFREILNAPRKFFQYQYTMRVLGEEFFGREVLLPRLQITYRVQNSLQGGAALQGREAQYSLVPIPIRVLSLVPPGTADIRDTPLDTFGDVETRLFRSNLLLIARRRGVRAFRTHGGDAARSRGRQAARDGRRSPAHRVAHFGASCGAPGDRDRARAESARWVERRARGTSGRCVASGGGGRAVAPGQSKSGESRHGAQ